MILDAPINVVTITRSSFYYYIAEWLIRQRGDQLLEKRKVEAKISTQWNDHQYIFSLSI